MATKDLYTNRAWFDVTESAANTLTFSEVNTGVQAFSRMAWVINRIDWHCGNVSELIASADRIKGAITSSNKVSSLDLEDPSIIAFLELITTVRSAVGSDPYIEPLVFDYSGLPGGGLIVPGYPLFIAVEGTSLTNPVHLSARVYFQILELKADEYIELVEATRMIT